MGHPVLDGVRAIGGVVFTEGDFNLNLVGIRTWKGASNRFDDVLHCIYCLLYTSPSPRD